MRTSDDARERARHLYALARATAQPDEALVCVLRAMELEARHPDRVGTADNPAPDESQAASMVAAKGGDRGRV